MTKDYLAGLILSGLLHTGLFFTDRWTARASHHPLSPEEVVPFVEWKPLPDDPPEVIDDLPNSPSADPAVSVPVLPEIVGQVDINTIEQPRQSVIATVRLSNIPVSIPTNVGSNGTGGRGRTLGNLVPFDLLDQQPRPKFQAKPVYPFEMRKEDVSGDVLVGFIVDARGAVLDPYVIRSTHHGFESSALQAVAKWKFVPGRKDGHAVNTRMQVPVVFSIQHD